MSNVLLDNDIVLKICCFDSSQELSNCLAEFNAPLAVLGVGRFVVRKLAAKKKEITNRSVVCKLVDEFLDSINSIEPTDNELLLAADFESTAQALNLPLDSGESQLLAVLVERLACLLVTGDKRAIKAIPDVVNHFGIESNVEGRVACFEQIILELVSRHSAAHFQGKRSIFPC